MKARPVIYRIGHGGYVSEFDQFLDNFLAQHPDVVEDRRRGWYIWWDKNIELAELEKLSKDEVPVKPYQYE